MNILRFAATGLLFSFISFATALSDNLVSTTATLPVSTLSTPRGLFSSYSDKSTVVSKKFKRGGGTPVSSVAGTPTYILSLSPAHVSSGTSSIETSTVSTLPTSSAADPDVNNAPFLLQFMVDWFKGSPIVPLAARISEQGDWVGWLSIALAIRLEAEKIPTKTNSLVFAASNAPPADLVVGTSASNPAFATIALLETFRTKDNVNTYCDKLKADLETMKQRRITTYSRFTRVVVGVAGSRQVMRALGKKKVSIGQIVFSLANACSGFKHVGIPVEGTPGDLGFILSFQEV